jgi:2-desacetyl-2-hydroxyethyl bacteriochlorophyllide A dehydrogenase
MMKALVWEGPFRVCVREREKPCPGKGEVLVKTKSVGVCGSDLEIFRGGFAQAVPPLVMGHEACGIVEEAAEGVENVRPGDRVVVDPSIFCGECEFCKRGSYWQCDHRGILGMQGRDGAYAQYFVMPARSCFRLPDGLPWDEAALIDIVADPLHAMDMISLAIGETVAVFGPGPAGLCFVQLAKLAGASKAILVGTRQERLALGRELGADMTIDVRKEDVLERILEITGGRGVDVAIEASGSTSALAEGFKVCRKQGKVMVFGIYSEKAVLDMQDMHRRELVILGSSGCPWAMPRAVDLVASKRVRVSPMITHRVDLEGLERLFMDGVMEHRRDGYIKGVLFM